MRRILILALCLLLMASPALAECCVADWYGTEEAAGYSLLIDGDGTVLTPPKAYTSIYELTPRGTPEAERLFCATPVEPEVPDAPEDLEEILNSMDYVRVALMDHTGRLLTGFDYDSLDWAGGCVVFSMPGEGRPVGAMDATGCVIIPPEFAGLKPLSDGCWLALEIPEDWDPEDYDALYGVCIIGDGGDVRKLDLHTRERYFTAGEGVATLWRVEEYGGQCAFVDASGAVLFDRGFESAEAFSGGLAEVESGGRYGLIDQNGRFAVPAEYDYINRFEGKCIAGVDGSGYALYDPVDCTLLSRVDFEGCEYVSVVPVLDNVVHVTVDGVGWLYSYDGECLRRIGDGVNIQIYDTPAGAVDRLVETFGEWPDSRAHLTNLAGDAVSAGYGDMRAAYWQDGAGRYIVSDYDFYTNEEGDVMIDWDSYRYGLIDQDGNVLLDEAYDQLYALSFDRFWAVQRDRRGMIDSTGKWYYYVSDYGDLMD